MKKALFLSLVLASGSSLMAQLPVWIVNPGYDSMSMKYADKIVEADSAGYSILWSSTGKRLFATQDSILPFSDGVATVVKAGDDGTIVGLVSEKGKFVKLPDLGVAYDNPYFDCGHIVCWDGDNYCFYNKAGQKVDLGMDAARCYPFHNGYALYFGYDEGGTKPYYGYLTPSGETVSFKVLDKGAAKPLEPSDVKFLSAVSGDGKAIGVIKDKLYWLNMKTMTFEPIQHGDPAMKKRQLSLLYKMDDAFVYPPSDTLEISAKYGKDDTAVLKFDGQLCPACVDFGDETVTFPDVRKSQVAEYTTSLKPCCENGRYGLTMGDEKVIPEQFEEIGGMYGNCAFVKLGGKWGMIGIDPDHGFSLQVNKGENVAFRHNRYATQMRLDLPEGIKAEDVRIFIPKNADYEIDKTSRSNVDTEEGNYVAYNCVLNIPQNLGDTLTAVSYAPIAVTWHGLTVCDAPVAVKAWHINHYKVDVPANETAVADGVASFVINVDPQLTADEGDYPFDIRIESDSINVEYGKINDTSFKCRVPGLHEGSCRMNVLVCENGCPPAVVPLEVSYRKADGAEHFKVERAIPLLSRSTSITKSVAAESAAPDDTADNSGDSSAAGDKKVEKKSIPAGIGPDMKEV